MDLEPDALSQLLILPEIKQPGANAVNIVEIDDFLDLHLLGCALVCLSFHLLAQVVHQLVDHVAQNLNVLVINFLLEVFQARLDNVCVQLVGDEELCEEEHVAVHLVLLPLPQLIIIIEVHDGLAEFFLVLFLGFLAHAIHRIPPLSLLSFDIEHLEELLLAFAYQQLLEVHLVILLVVELLEEQSAQSDIDIEVGMLTGTLDEDHLHELIEQRWRVLESLE